MTETDLWWMTALIFTPCVFALAILFVPRGREEVMRWLALFGTAVTLAVSIIVFMGYLEQPGVAIPGGLSSLEARTDIAAQVQGVQVPPGGGPAAGARPPASNDWVSRVPWIRQFNIDYFLGVDGISIALLLLTTALSFLASRASW